MSHEVSLDGYPPSASSERQAIRLAGAWAFVKHYNLPFIEDTIVARSIIAGNHVLDVLTYTTSPNLLLTVGKPYSEIVVMATLQLQERTCRLVGWEYSDEVRNQLYPPKIFGGRLCNYIHQSRLQHMILLESLLELKHGVA